MLNLKKGLALVLAAATAFTFAPVATLPALADNVASDGLTKGTGIDSNPASVTVADDGTASTEIWLQEHEQKSNSGIYTAAYKITIQKHQKDDGTYEDAVGLIADDSNAGGVVSGKSAINNSNSGSAAKPDAITSKDSAGQPDSTYLVKAKDQSRTSTGTNVGTLNDLGGARIAFNSLRKPKAQGTYTVKITGLAAFDENAQELDSSTITVTITKTSEKFKITKTAYTVAEQSDINVAYTIADRADSSKLHITTDNSSVVRDSVTEPTNTTSDYSWDVSVPAGTTVADQFALYADEAGTTTITVEDQKSNGDVIASATITVKVTPKNGKLYVSYETNSGYFTYTDDIAFASGSNQTYQSHASTDEAMNNKGEFKDGTEVKQSNGYAYLNGRLSSTKVTNLTSSDTSKVEYVLKAYDRAVTPSAKTLYADGTKTVQINASSDSGAEISYALVAPARFEDVAADGTTAVTSTDLNDVHPEFGDLSKAVKMAKLSGDVSKTAVYTASKYGQDSTVVYTETAAKEYGSIDKNGLVTLKDGKHAPNLYVVVTAKGAAKTDTTPARATSTYLIPVNLENQAPVKLYVSDSKCFAEQWGGYTSAAQYNLKAHNTLYLSLTDRTTDTLNVKSNVSDNYITITSSDPSVVSVSGKTLTAHKEGTATISVKTSSAPEVSGITDVTLKVVVNKLLSTNVVTAKGVAVNKEHQSAKVDAQSNVSDSTIIFDRDSLYRVDSDMPSGYTRIGVTDDHYGDVTVSTTGNVTYQANSGTVYVRAYASGTDKYNPSTYVYVPVNYGQKVVTTDLKVDQTPITLAVKETKKITASVASGASITYTSQDPTVATVAADGTVTAVKSGTTYVTVTGVAADGTTAESAVVAVIVKGNATITDDTVKKPSKVTGVKVTNLKGGKVKVTWTKQNQKNIKYYVKKTVGKKSAGKSVGSNKTTLSVKKGATVKVKVKAYIYNAEGTKLVGSYSKTITKKTDKK